MAIQVQFKRGTQSQNNNFTGAAGEISVNTDTNSLRVHNGIATGGFELARADLSNTTGQAPYAVSAGIATYSGRSGISTYASTAGIATYATSSGVSTTLTATSSVNTTGIITASKFVGDGSGLTNITGGGASSRTVVSGVTTALVVNGIGNTEISGFKTYGLLKVGVSSAAWVRLYTDSTSRSNDASRSIEVDPTTGSGVIAEVATAGIATVKMTPFIVGFNDDNPVTNTIYVSVKNLTGITTSILVNLTILKMEE